MATVVCEYASFRETARRRRCARGPSRVYSGRDRVVGSPARQNRALVDRRFARIRSEIEAHRGMDSVRGGVVSNRQGCRRARCDRRRAERAVGVIHVLRV